MSATPELTCVFCKEVFEEKESLQIHFRKHADPKFNQTKAKNGPQNDEQKPSEKTNEETEMVQCDACSEVFPTISKAITHKHKVHPDLDAKYFCPCCGKLFTLKHLYNKHLSSHGSIEENNAKDFHCDSCEVDFYVAAAMLHHNKFFHRQDTMLPDIGHSRKQKLFNQELLPIYYCTFCGEEYNNKVNLHKHMHDDHSDENQSPDEVLRCPLCNAIFYHLDAYELHLTYHSSEDLYSEKNEIHENEISEYSIETVPPLMERVENMEDNNSVDLEKFLQIAMDSDNPNNEQPERKKKHKKHKKSKKTITLDEFLNMNSDVFGEGLDFQGIEEVPTQVVAKQLKTKRTPQASRGSSQIASSSDLEKLKKQGIIVKTKSGKNFTPLQGLKLGNKIHSHANKSLTLDKKVPESHTKVITTSSNEVLSKLINQSNNQISIVKKPVQEFPDSNKEELKTSESKDAVPVITESTLNDNDSATKKIGETEKIKATKELSEENLLKNTLTDNLEKDFEEYESLSKDLVDQDNNTSNKSNILAKLISGVKDYANDIQSDKNLDYDDSQNNKHQSNLSNTVNHLKSVNQQITIKSVKQSPNNPLHEKESFEETEAEAISEKYPNSATNVGKETETDNHIEKIHSMDIKEEKLDLSNKLVKKPLDALKHLGNITIKSVNQSKSQITDAIDDSKLQCDPSNIENDSDMEEDIPMETQNKLDESNLNQFSSIQPDIPHAQKPVNALKNLSSITVKPVIQSPKVDTEEYTDDENYEDSGISSDQVALRVGNHKNITIPGQNVLFKSSTQKLNTSIQSLGHFSPTHKNTSQHNDESRVFDECLTKPHQTTDMLKHLKNVTAKPLTVMKNSSQVTFKSATQSVNMTNKQFMQQSTKKLELSEEVEIFNVDDSDSDREDNQCKTIVPGNSSNKIHNKLKYVESLKTLNKNTTVKTANQQINKNIERHSLTTVNTRNDKMFFTQADSFGNSNENGLVKPTADSGNNTALKNALKNLGKNITIKSRNASPNFSMKSPDYNKDEYLENYNTDEIESDTDSIPGNVKITEITEDNMSDDEFPEKLVENQSHSDNNICKSIVARSPQHSFSDDEEDNYELMDVEEKIKTNSLNKLNQSTLPVSQQSPYKESFKNIGKNITIKSIGDKKTFNEKELKVDNEPRRETPEFPESLNKELTIKSLRQTNVGQDVNKTPNNQSSSDQILHQKGNEMNTVNKEVTVKTYKTETVIEEITTTVTKTIRTVNQTTKQELQNKNLASSTPPVRMQRVGQNIRCNQQVRNAPGISVRHISPMAQPRMRHPMNPVRPPVSPVRPSNQLVPVRAGLNVARPSNPRMPTVNKMIPSQSSQTKPVIGKPLKISPNVMNATNKRPILNQQPGPFKKPKDVFMPDPDMAMPNSGKCTVNFASTSQTSSCNFTSTKTLKGNSVVASTQMKSEMSSSQQCFSKLNNVTGLKIVKSNQAKQVTKFEEKYDSASKRTLDAIEMLQKQGLLVKKPRLNFNDDSEHSNSGDEETTNYTVEEFED